MDDTVSGLRRIADSLDGSRVAQADGGSLERAFWNLDQLKSGAGLAKGMLGDMMSKPELVDGQAARDFERDVKSVLKDLNTALGKLHKMYDSFDA